MNWISSVATNCSLLFTKQPQRFILPRAFCGSSDNLIKRSKVTQPYHPLGVIVSAAVLLENRPAGWCSFATGPASANTITVVPLQLWFLPGLSLGCVGLQYKGVFIQFVAYTFVMEKHFLTREWLFHWGNTSEQLQVTGGSDWAPPHHLLPAWTDSSHHGRRVRDGLAVSTVELNHK